MLSTRIADSILCPPLVRTERTLHLPDCAAIKGRKSWPCKWAEGRTLGDVYDSLQGAGKVKPCLRCDPLFRPDLDLGPINPAAIERDPGGSDHGAGAMEGSARAAGLGPAPVGVGVVRANEKDKA